MWLYIKRKLIQSWQPNFLSSNSTAFKLRQLHTKTSCKIIKKFQSKVTRFLEMVSSTQWDVAQFVVLKSIWRENQLSSLTSNCHQTHLVLTSNTFIFHNHSPQECLMYCTLLAGFITIDNQHSEKEASISFITSDIMHKMDHRFLHSTSQWFLQ